MTIRATISAEGDITFLEFHGKLNFENQQHLREEIADVLQKNRQVVVDLNGLDFVGSSGITNFIQTIRDVGLELGLMPRFCNVGREFRRIMDAFHIQPEIIHATRPRSASQSTREVPRSVFSAAASS